MEKGGHDLDHPLWSARLLRDDPDAIAAVHRAYLEAGADILFVEAPRTVAEMRAVTARFAPRIPLLANMVEGGQTPLLTAEALGDIGYRIAIFPGGAVRFLAAAGAAYYQSLVKTGSNAAMADRMHDLASLNDLLGTSDLLALGDTYKGDE